MDVNLGVQAAEVHAAEMPASEPPRSDSQMPGSSAADPAVRRLAAVVDDLTNLESLPVEAHAARYREVHNVLQDALSDTDRGGPQPS